MPDQETPALSQRRHLVARYGRFRVDRETFRVGAGPWQDFGFHRLVLETTSSTEFDVSIPPLRAQVLGSLPSVVRYIRYWLDSRAPGLEGGTEVWPWHPRRVSDERASDNDIPDANARLPDWSFVTNHEAYPLVAEALAELEREHPDLQHDPGDDYIFPDPEPRRQGAAWRAYRGEWRKLHGAWPTAKGVEPGPLVAQYGPFHVHAVKLHGLRLWVGRDKLWAHMIVFDGGEAGTRLLCTEDTPTHLLRHAEWEWVARYVVMWLTMLEDSIAMGCKALAETTDSAMRGEIERGLALREQWHRLVQRALHDRRATLGTDELT